jgi:uncharacterized membrane protein YcfT
VLHFLQLLQDTTYANWVRQGWGWAIALTVHAFGSATVVGLIFIIGLRLFGLFRTIPLNSIRAFFPFIWAAVICQVLSGVTLWLTKPVSYVVDGVFDVKFSLVVIGVTLTVFYQRFLRREVSTWEVTGAVSVSGVRFAALTCVVWAGVLIMGRLTAYLGQLYQAPS